ncbi:MAG: polyribonucleotide nucleotidyltransferase, partial [bacterium]|nr:polyribonucleotide nucleotidyltransferase [bacterium]
MKVRVEKKIGKETLSFETGLLAKQAAGAVVAQYGETVVLCATATGPPRPGIDFFPLMCDYRERMAAGGKFPGGFLKREGRPTTKETLTSRLIDRPIRPMFAKGFNDEVQCQSFVLASDKVNDGDVIAMNGVCAALHISPMPFEGPLASIRVGRVEGEFIAFPSQDDLEESDLDLIVSGNLESVLMIEGFAREMPEDDMVNAILFAHETIKEICELQNELAEKVAVEKMAFESPGDDPFIEELRNNCFAELKTANQIAGKHERGDAVSALKTKFKEKYLPESESGDVVGQVVSAVQTFAGSMSGDEPLTEARFNKAWSTVNKAAVRELILDGVRSDGRKSDELRAIECHVDVLPRVHGSAVFQRGETQSLMTVTLGTARDEQRVDGLLDEYSKKFMLDYNFPSFSVGEV